MKRCNPQEPLDDALLRALEGHVCVAEDYVPPTSKAKSAAVPKKKMLAAVSKGSSSSGVWKAEPTMMISEGEEDKPQRPTVIVSDDEADKQKRDGFDPTGTAQQPSATEQRRSMA